MVFRAAKPFSLLLRSSGKALLRRLKKTAFGQLVNCQLSLFSGSLKSDNREQ
jgi:hypothetical protein